MIFAVGIADGLASWSRTIDPGSAPPPPIEPSYPAINIKMNGQNYEEQGILVSGNAYIPIDLIDRLRIDLSKNPDVRRITYRRVVYVKAVELRDFNVSVGWDAPTRTVILKSNLQILCR